MLKNLHVWIIAAAVKAQSPVIEFSFKLGDSQTPNIYLETSAASFSIVVKLMFSSNGHFSNQIDRKHYSFLSGFA